MFQARAKLLLALVVGFIALATVCLYFTRIPAVARDPETFWNQKGLQQISLDDSLSTVIWRAKWDFALFPTEVGSRTLVLQSANQNENILYLVFRPTGTSHTAVVYAYTRDKRRPLWKAQIAMD